MRFVEHTTNSDDPATATADATRESHNGQNGYDERQVVTIADIWEAHKLLKPRLHHTPLTLSRTLHDLTGADIYLKAENTQRSGSFKVRGASYKLSRLSAHEYERGVIA